MFKKIHFKEKKDEFIPKLQWADKSFIFVCLKNMKFSIWIKNLFFQSFYSAIVAEMPCFYMTRAQNWWSAAPSSLLIMYLYVNIDSRSSCRLIVNIESAGRHQALSQQT